MLCIISKRSNWRKIITYWWWVEQASGKNGRIKIVFWLLLVQSSKIISKFTLFRLCTCSFQMAPTFYIQCISTVYFHQILIESVICCSLNTNSSSIASFLNDFWPFWIFTLIINTTKFILLYAYNIQFQIITMFPGWMVRKEKKHRE